MPLHIDCSGQSEPIALQLKPPGGPADAEGEFRVLCRKRRNCEARARRTRLRRAALTQEQTGDAALAGTERQPPARGKIEACGIAPYFADRRGKAGAAKSFLEDPECLAGFFDAHRDEPPGIESEARETGAVGYACFARRTGLAHPENRTPVSARDPRDKSSRETMRRTRRTHLRAADFVQRAERQPAAEHPVERGKAKRKQTGRPRGGPRG